jgi:sugar O-acyltransferase (sialic acid O-acetyltransferase NeuD family)
MRIAILGASGHGKVVGDIALMGGYSDIVFFDDLWPDKISIGNWSIVGSIDTLISSAIKFDSVIVGIGNNQARIEKYNKLTKVKSVSLVTLKHPSAVVSKFAQIGLGSVICAGAIVNIDSIIGDAVIVNTNATVDHDCRLANGVHISPGAHLSGGVHVGTNSWVGVGACVKQNVHIGSNVIIGAGAVVVSDIYDDTVVVGNPARLMERK